MKEVNDFSQTSNADERHLSGGTTRGHRGIVKVNLGTSEKDRQEQLSRAQDVSQRHESIQRSFIEMALGEDKEFDQFFREDVTSIDQIKDINMYFPKERR